MSQSPIERTPPKLTAFQVNSDFDLRSRLWDTPMMVNLEGLHAGAKRGEPLLVISGVIKRILFS